MIVQWTGNSLCLKFERLKVLYFSFQALNILYFQVSVACRFFFFLDVVFLPSHLIRIGCWLPSPLLCFFANILPVTKFDLLVMDFVLFYSIFYISFFPGDVDERQIFLSIFVVSCFSYFFLLRLLNNIEATPAVPSRSLVGEKSQLLTAWDRFGGKSSSSISLASVVSTHEKKKREHPPLFHRKIQPMDIRQSINFYVVNVNGSLVSLSPALSKCSHGGEKNQRLTTSNM